MEPKWIVIRKRDDAPVEVIPFGDELDARALYEDMSVNWTECYLCKIVEPIRK